LVELVLYISSSSPSSARARANLTRILRRYKSRQISLTVHDLHREPEFAERDQIAFTPTLCKRAPEPPLWIFGDLSSPQPLIELLEFYGVESTHGHRQAHDRHSRI
jgi:hypothetical protein